MTVAAAALACYRAVRLASIGAAYVAKTLCSGVFVSHREAAAILDSDLSLGQFPILRLIRTSIDVERKRVTADFLGIVKRSAQYTPGLGCSLCHDDAPVQPPAVSSPPPASTAPLIENFAPCYDAVLDWAFSEPDPDRLRRTRAVVILHEGRIVAERYAPGFGMDTPIHGWSMAKAAVNALAGILVKRGLLTLDDPVPLPQWQHPGDPRQKITLNNLLQMSSGLHFKEEYGDPLQDVVRMLFVIPDAASYAANKRLEAEPGSRWGYSSGNTNIICGVMKYVLGETEYAGFPRTALFEPLGMSSAVIERDASGTFVGSSFMYATARDWAKLGQLYLQDGVWAGGQILPEGWVRYSTTPAPKAPEREYGAHLWLRVPGEYRSDDAADAVPPDAFHAVGHEGQLMTMIPSRELVIVRLGLTRSPAVWPHDRFVQRVLTERQSL